MRKRSIALAALGLSLAGVFLVYGRSLPHEFVYDDHWTIVRNPHLAKPQPLLRYFTDPETVAHPSVGMGPRIYRPLPTMTFLADVRMWGLTPWAFRITNLILHALNGFLLFLLASRKLKMSAAAAGLAASVFLFHPVQVESVVWITQRSNLLCLLGILAGLWFLSGPDRLKSWQMAAGFFALSAALLSKETAVVFGSLLFLLDGRHTRSLRQAIRDRWKFYVAVALVTMLYLALRRGVGVEMAQRDYRTGSLWGNLMIGGLSWLEYIRLVLAPVNLTVSHGQYVDVPWRHGLPWLGLLALAAYPGLVAALWRKKPRHRVAALGLAWFLLGLLPVLGLVPIDTFVAERFLYAPLAGIGLAAAGLWDYLGSSPRETRQFRLGARWLLGLWVAVLAVLTVAYVGAWRNDLALWKSAVHQEPRNAFARACLAEALSAAGQLEAAREEYQTALRNGPSMAVAVSCLTNLAEIENRLGRPEQALAWSRKALQAQPRAAPALYNEIVALALLSRRSEALSVLERAEATHPDSPAWARLRAQVLATPVKRFRP